MKFNIMFVYNSISEPESLQCLFNNEPYYVFAFDNPLDALNVVKTLDWAVVVADRSMHNMDGVEFLNKIRAHSPQAIGIIMKPKKARRRYIRTRFIGISKNPWTTLK